MIFIKTTVVVNPHAGRQNILKELEEVEKIFAASGEVAVVQTQSAEQASAVIRAAAAEKPDRLVCCGGDGTLSETISVLAETGADVALGYIPAGSTNDFASSLGLPKEPIMVAQQIEAIQPRPIDIGRFGDRHFIYVASFGAFTQTSYNTTQSLKNSLGHLAYFIEGIKELPQIKSYHVRVKTDEGAEYEGEYLFGSLSNSTSFGGIIKLDPEKVALDDGKFELTLVKKPKNLHELNKIIFSLMSGKYDEELITFVHTAGVSFTCAEAMPWSLDGEYAAGGNEVKAEAIEKAIRLYY